MSLFPAYIGEPGSSSETLKKDESYDAKSWLTNSSFIPFQTVAAIPLPEANSQEEANKTYYSQISDSSEEERHKESKKQKKGKKKKSRKSSPEPPQPTPIEFTGDEEYYVDKEPIKGYLSVQKLHKPACPRYRIRLRLLGNLPFSRDKFPKRYFSKKYAVKDSSPENLSSANSHAMPEEQFTMKNKEFNRILAQNPRNIEKWIEYVRHQNGVPMKATRTQLAERKIEIIEKALVHNQGNEKLYKVYVEIIDSTYPSFEVSKFLEKLLEKDPTNYILWSAQIYATQGSMARCIVPDVLKLYEECMQKMYRKSQDDEVMLKLFTGVALFLRQAGLNEQFFALIKLALELNVSVDKFQTIQPSEKDQQTLIEYEEVILKSGLPMNEIWLRIEKLRQNYNFLPCPTTTSNCNDPQRIVFNEDICYFIFPLANKENCFALIVIILRLLKIPFLATSSLRQQFLFKAESLNEFDSIEDILAVCLHQTTSLFVNSLNFDVILYELVKEMITSPSFLSSNIGYEIYLKTISDILLICSECFHDDERKRTIFVLQWLRFERILLIVEKLSSKLSTDGIKRTKTRVKNILKREENRNVLNFYTEYALIECELGNMHVAENIFVTSISEGSSDVPNSDFCHAHVTYAEILIRAENYTKAMKVLTCLALDISLEELSGEILSEPRKLVSLKKLTERFNDLVFIEKNVQIMELEQYFLPGYFISLLKAKIYYQVLLKDRLEAMAFLENLLRHFIEKNSRHTYIRESIYELYLKVMQWSDRTCLVSNSLIYETASKALSEFPENLFILRTCSAALESHSWYKIRSLLRKTDSPLGIVFLIAAARYRLLKYNCNDDTTSECMLVYKRRVANILQAVVDKNSPLRKNSIMWRLYLRSLCDIQASFDRSKNALFSALDECPWHKALYLDGSVYVPQELSQIQDLIIEKQLRIYALPEELEILRNDTFEVAPAATTTSSDIKIE